MTSVGNHDQKVYDWLKAPDHTAKHTSACNRREKESGSWLVQGERFKEWKLATNSFLWLNGIRTSSIKMLQ